jgi:hypothetical protein
VLGKVVRPRELLATLVAFERLVMSVERAIVALKVLLATEAARAESADEGLAGVFGQGLLATAAVGWGLRWGRAVCVSRSLSIISVVAIILGCSLGCTLAFSVAMDVGVRVSEARKLQVAVDGAGALVHLALSLLLWCAAGTRVREGGSGRRWQTGLSSVVFLVKTAKAVDAEEVLLFTNTQSDSLVTVVGNLRVGEVDEAEFVFGVQFGAEG